MSTSQFKLIESRTTIRFVRGYRYLDKCGEALIRLEEALHEHWMPTEIAPKGGVLVNHTLGLTAYFNAEAVTIQQVEYDSFDHYLDQTCKVVDVLRATFGIERLLAPAAAHVFQLGFKEGEIAAAESELQKLNLVQLSSALGPLFGGGHPEALNYAVVFALPKGWRDIPAEFSRRLEAKVVQQITQPSFDMRVLVRASTLREKQRDALAGHIALKRAHPGRSPVAIQLDMEARLGGEVAATDLPLNDFLRDTHAWALAGIEHIRAASREG